jgi:hypothetical protein
MQEFKSFEELEQAYKALKQEVALLEQEWRATGVIEDVNSFECEFLEEQTAKEVIKPVILGIYLNCIAQGVLHFMITVFKVTSNNPRKNLNPPPKIFSILQKLQLGVAGVTALGVGTLHKIIKLIFSPKAAAPLIGGAWVLGGAFIIFHFTASTTAGWAMMTQRNARRKRMLQRKLEAIQRHLNSLTADNPELNIAPAAAAVAAAGGGVEETGQPHVEEISEVLDEEGRPIRRSSPSHSTGSSVELVEAPSPENEPEGGGGAGSGAPTSASSKKPESGGYSLDSWKRYASLGSSKKKDK